MALSAENRIKVKLELLWLRARGVVTFVTTPTEDEAIAAITSDQQTMIEALLPAVAASSCAAESLDAAQIKKLRDIEFVDGALANTEYKREQLARQLATLLGLIDSTASSALLVVGGGVARPTFLTSYCDEETS